MATSGRSYVSRMLLRAVVAGGAAGFTLPALAQVPAPAQAPAPVAQTPGAATTRSLLENANYWRSRGDPKAALQMLERVLTYSPNDPDVLAAAAETAFQAANYEAAARYRAKLAQVAPGDPRLPTLAADRQLSSEDQTLLARARQLAGEGKNVEAVAAYRELFHGQVLPGFAVEYYTALGLTTSEGFDEANKQLGVLADRLPNDLPLQLSYARLLVLQEDTRAEGIKRLEELSQRPGVDRAARQVWREVLLWQGPSERARSQLEEYMRENPSDPAIEAKMRDYLAVLPDESTKALMRGYYAMSVKDMAKAEQEFTASYKLNPQNANAAFMLGVFRRSQGHEAEAQALIAKAIALAPDRRDELIQASGGNYRVRLPPEAEQMIEVSRLYATGHYDEAEQTLISLSSGHETASTYIQLGEIQLRAGRLDDADTSFRKARDMAPASGDAVCGAANVMARKGRFDEAAALYTAAAALYAKARNPSGALRVSSGRADLVRARAAALTPAAAASLYAGAIAADPRNMTLRLDYARLLRQAGRGDEAWSLVAQGIDANHRDQATLRQALDFAIQGGDRQHATELSQQLNASPGSRAVQVLARKPRQR